MTKIIFEYYMQFLLEMNIHLIIQDFRRRVLYTPTKEKVMKQVAVIKVHFLAGKTVKDAMELLQMAFGDQALKKT